MTPPTPKGPPRRARLARDVTSALLLIAGYLTVMIAAHSTDPRLAAAFIGATAFVVGALLGYDRPPR